MDSSNIHDYRMLVTVVLAWWMAQWLKVPISRLVNGRWNWRLLFAAGGMPSSHSSLVTATATAVGLYTGCDTPAFAIALAIALVVIYDAVGVRRQAGFHAQQINTLVNELLSGHPISEKRLKEVLGHSPFEVTMGVLFGFFLAWGIWLIWR
jgi:acid phosphatase family membrane protein YuiD